MLRFLHYSLESRVNKIDCRRAFSNATKLPNSSIRFYFIEKKGVEGIITLELFISA